MAVLASAPVQTQTQGSEVVSLFDLGNHTQVLGKVRVIVEVGAAPTGTTPTLDYAVAWSGQNEEFAAFSTETALTQQTAEGAAIDELTAAGRFLRLTPTVGGTASPAFTQVRITIVA